MSEIERITTYDPAQIREGAQKAAEKATMLASMYAAIRDADPSCTGALVSMLVMDAGRVGDKAGANVQFAIDGDTEAVVVAAAILLRSLADTDPDLVARVMSLFLDEDDFFQIPPDTFKQGMN